ncbi:MAG: exonuclease domain-containing protein [Nocardioidaceae bacterium]
MIDVETTGLRSETHRIIELAVVTTDPWGPNGVFAGQTPLVGATGIEPVTPCL